MSEVIDSFEAPPYRFLSNFYASEIMVLGHKYATVEHAYQAWKATTPTDAELVRDASTPGKAKRLGRLLPKRDDWDSIKVDVMTVLIRLKFKDPTLAKWLLSTGEAKLVEGNTWGDEFWGVCNGRGWNKLGSILMTVRAELAATAQL